MQELIFLHIFFSDSELLFSHINRTSSVALRDRFSCCISRGVMRPTAAFVIKRSRSPITLIQCVSFSLISASLIKISTILSLSSIGSISFKGMSIHRLISLEPIGETVLSTTSSNVHALSLWEPVISRLRMVKRSNHTYFFCSTRLICVMLAVCVCCVS